MDVLRERKRVEGVAGGFGERVIKYMIGIQVFLVFFSGTDLQ
jgi:hypothetical protein